MIRSLLAVVFGVMFGVFSGWVGVSIDHYNESKHGGQYRKYQWDVLTIPALPGMIWVNYKAGYDWRIDEAWSFRGKIIVANSIFWGATSLLLRIGWEFVSRGRRRVPSARDDERPPAEQG